MTIAQAERFYEQDSKKYDISNNKELLTWLKDAIKNGYNSFSDIESLQGLINNIAYWYEIKYPKRAMEKYEDNVYFKFENINDLAKMMDIQQLMYRLPHQQLCLMKCDYRSGEGSIKKIYNDKGERIADKQIIIIKIGIKHNDFPNEKPYFLLSADADTGVVDISKHTLKKYINNNITLDELLVIFKERYKNELDFLELEECIYNHNCDLKLRKMILQLASLKILYNDDDHIPEVGYERAKRYINEFNKEMNLELSTEELEQLLRKCTVVSNKEKNLINILLKK